MKQKAPVMGCTFSSPCIKQGYKGIIVSGKRIISDCQTDYNGKDASADGL